MQNLHVNTIIAKFFVGQNIVTSQKQTHDLPFFGGATGVVAQQNDSPNQTSRDFV